MKKIIITSKLLLIIGALTLGLTSCNKDNVTDSPEAVAAQNLNVAEVEDDNSQIMADQAESEGAVNLRTSPVYNSAFDLITGCAIVTRDSLSTPKKITIDFGTGCTNANGVTRKGKVIVTYTGRYRDSLTVIHIVSENYFVNDNKVDIDRTITNKGHNPSGNLEFGIHAVRMITFADGATSSSTVDKTREWIAGAGTPRDFTDDIYRVNGTGTHTSKRGIVYDASTITALIRKVSCHQFVSGEVKIIRHGATDRFGIIDFGTGDCDDIATITLDNGRSHSINLRH